MTVDHGDVRGLALGLMRKHLLAIEKRMEDCGDTMNETELEGVINIARTMGIVTKAPAAKGAPPISGKSVKELLEATAKEFPELRETLAALGGAG